MSSPSGVTVTSPALRSKELHIQLFFQLFDRHRQRGLRDIAGIGRMAEVLFARHGDDVLEFGEGHGVFHQRLMP
jgi:hypothetical protein